MARLQPAARLDASAVASLKSCRKGLPSLGCVANKRKKAEWDVWGGGQAEAERTERFYFSVLLENQDATIANDDKSASRRIISFLSHFTASSWVPSAGVGITVHARTRDGRKGKGSKGEEEERYESQETSWSLREKRGVDGVGGSSGARSVGWDGWR